MFHTPDSIRIFLDTVRGIDLRGVLDIVLIALLIYGVLVWLKGSTGMTLVRGIGFLVVSGIVLNAFLGLTVVGWLLRNSVPALLIAVPIIFQPELRRAFERLGRARVATRRHPRASEIVLATIADACDELSAQRTGALIVLERETGLDEYLRTGTPVDAVPSGSLFGNLFWKNSPLHDGAVIVRDNRVAAAGCTLPLSDAKMPGHLGTRHRAALGTSERTDALIVVVSEETGGISVAMNGQFLGNLDRDRLRTLLTDQMGHAPSAPLPFIFGREARYARQDDADDKLRRFPHP